MSSSFLLVYIFAKITLIVSESVLIMKGSPIKYDGEIVEFSCHFKESSINDIEWYLDSGPLPILQRTLVRGSLDQESRITVKVLGSWSGKKISCKNVFTNEEDFLRLDVTAQRFKTSFYITERIPKGVSGEIPEVILATNASFGFSCSSSLPWHVCQWKSPRFEDPCGIFSYDKKKKCAKWSNNAFEVEAVSKKNCSLLGTYSVKDEGLWNCEMQSYPIGQEDRYDHDQQYFQLKIVRQPIVNIILPKEMRVIENKNVNISLSFQKAFPLPKVSFAINSVEIQLVSSVISNAILDSKGYYSQSHIYEYTPKIHHHTKKLIIKLSQRDDSNTVVTQSFETLLKIDEEIFHEKTKSMSGGIISAIVICTIVPLFIILLAILLRKRCFSNQSVIIVKNERKNMEKTLDSTLMMDSERLLGKGQDITESLIPITKISLDSIDDYIHFKYEGTGSTAGSLSSLESESSCVDWEDTFRSFGSKFKILADLSGGFSEDDEGTEI